MSIKVSCDCCGKPAISSHAPDRYMLRMDLCHVCLVKWVNFALDQLGKYRAGATSAAVDHGLSRAIMDAVVTASSVGLPVPIGQPAKPPEGPKALHRLVEHFITINKPL